MGNLWEGIASPQKYVEPSISAFKMTARPFRVASGVKMAVKRKALANGHSFAIIFENGPDSFLAFKHSFGFFPSRFP